MVELPLVASAAGCASCAAHKTPRKILSRHHTHAHNNSTHSLSNVEPICLHGPHTWINPCPPSPRSLLLCGSRRRRTFPTSMRLALFFNAQGGMGACPRDVCVCVCVCAPDGAALQPVWLCPLAFLGQPAARFEWGSGQPVGALLCASSLVF